MTTSVGTATAIPVQVVRKLSDVSDAGGALLNVTVTVRYGHFRVISDSSNPGIGLMHCLSPAQSDGRDQCAGACDE